MDNNDRSIEGLITLWRTPDPLDNTQARINFVGKRIAFTDENRVGKIVELFSDLHYTVEFEDNQERREIHVKEIRIGDDVIK